MTWGCDSTADTLFISSMDMSVGRDAERRRTINLWHLDVKVLASLSVRSARWD